MLKKSMLIACFFVGIQTLHAQSLGSLVNTAKNAVTQAVSSAKDNVQAALIGTQTVTVKQLVGTWTYQQPALVFESNNLLNQVGAAAFTEKAEKSAGYLSKFGVKAGSLSITFNDNGHYAATLKGRSISGTYKLNGATLTLVAPQRVVTVPVNAKLQGNQLQLAVHADKLLPLLQTLIGSASQVTEQAATITSVLKQYKGAFLGLKLKK
ncbi:lipocalin-like domain-containing protein [Ihuprevotella massiliensis]|uniref:lipocalin-like domain-containing protein n=1 Tax=Ihuprevotella massiliensis TaxID=1852368 RepID=UPI0009F5EE8D